jgi:lipoprotein-anchoring transpeptidase ErfK/SrfK
MVFRAAGLIAIALIGFGISAGQSCAQHLAYPPSRAYPAGSPYRPSPPYDVGNGASHQRHIYGSPHGGLPPTGADDVDDVDPRETAAVQLDPRSMAALPPEVRPETGPRKELPPELRRTLVDYPTRERVGTIVVDTPRTYLYLVLGNGKALRYGIGVGREGFKWAGEEKISRMAEWPDWNPPEQMIERQPYLPRFMAGGEGNPLGARALYLGNTLYRIHGTNQPSTIGTFVSSGCIRLSNEDITDLYTRVKVGTRVVVLRGGAPTSTAAAPTRSSVGAPAAGTGGSSASDVPRKRPKPEEIAMKLLQVDALVSQGQSVAAATRKVGMTESTYFRWRQELGFKNDEPRSPKEPRPEQAKGSAQQKAGSGRDTSHRTEANAQSSNFEE